MSEIDVPDELKSKFLTTITQQGPGADTPDGRRRLDEKQYPEIQQFKVEIWPNEGQHRGRPHCRVTTDKGTVTVDIATGEIISGNANRWSASITKAVLNHKDGLQSLWDRMRPDDQKLPAVSND